METIRFLPDRLNAEPTVFRGFTTPELGLAALTGFFTGLLWSLPFVPVGDYTHRRPADPAGSCLDRGGMDQPSEAGETG